MKSDINIWLGDTNGTTVRSRVSGLEVCTDRLNQNPGLYDGLFWGPRSNRGRGPTEGTGVWSPGEVWSGWVSRDRLGPLSRKSGRRRLCLRSGWIVVLFGTSGSEVLVGSKVWSGLNIIECRGLKYRWGRGPTVVTGVRTPTVSTCVWGPDGSQYTLGRRGENSDRGYRGWRSSETSIRVESSEVTTKSGIPVSYVLTGTSEYKVQTRVSGSWVPSGTHGSEVWSWVCCSKIRIGLPGSRGPVGGTETRSPVGRRHWSSRYGHDVWVRNVDGVVVRSVSEVQLGVPGSTVTRTKSFGFQVRLKLSGTSVRTGFVNPRSIWVLLGPKSNQKKGCLVPWSECKYLSQRSYGVMVRSGPGYLSPRSS